MVKPRPVVVVSPRLPGARPERHPDELGDGWTQDSLL